MEPPWSVRSSLSLSVLINSYQFLWILIRFNPFISVLINSYPSLSILIRSYPFLSVYIRLYPSSSVLIRSSLCLYVLHAIFTPQNPHLSSLTTPCHVLLYLRSRDDLFFIGTEWDWLTRSSKIIPKKTTSSSRCRYCKYFNTNGHYYYLFRWNA